MRGNNYRNNYRNNRRNNRRNDVDEDDYDNNYEEDDEEEDEEEDYRSKKSKKKSNVYTIIFVAFALAICFCIYVYMTIPSEVRGATPDSPGTADTTNQTAKPQEVPGDFTPISFIFKPHFDSNGNDIKKVTGSIGEMTTACMADSNCKGFNTSGWLKNKIKPENEWGRWTNDPQQGLYIRKDTIRMGQ